MPKTNKKTKKFNQKHLKSTIEKRKKDQVVAKRKQKSAGKTKNSKESEEEELDDVGIFHVPENKSYGFKILCF